MAAAKIMTPKEFAIEVESDARTVRKFLRSPEGTGRVGKGHRHAIKNTAALRRAFAAWDADRTPAADAPDEIDEVEDEATED